MRFAKLTKQLTQGRDKDKINTLSYLCDVFESYNKNIEHFDEIVRLLIDGAIAEENLEIKGEFFEALSKAAVFHDVEHIDFDKIAQNLDSLPIACLVRGIDILSFTHNLKYLPTIEKYRNHENEYVREAVETAIKEMTG